MTVAFSYLARPAKHVLRQLLAEACRRLAPVASPATYRYVGFGGLEFVDFELFRRALGINPMISIEHDERRHERYRFNRPFAEIELLAGRASDRLPELEWATLSIVWLDYEWAVVHEVLADVGFLSHELLPGSVLIVTANAVSPRPADSRRATLAENVGEERVPPGATDESLAQWGWAAAQRDVLVDTTDTEFATRRDGARLEQLFDFVYADGAEMQTWGGIVKSPGNERLVEQCHFEDLDFIRRRGDEALEIRVPVLTRRETLHLNRQLPMESGQRLEGVGIVDEELEAYARFYRWYPAPS